MRFSRQLDCGRSADERQIARTGNSQPTAPEGRRRWRPEGPQLGQLPLARRDVERLRQILALQRGCATSRPTHEPSAALITAAFPAKRWPGWKFHGAPSTWSSTEDMLAETEPAEADTGTRAA